MSHGLSYAANRIDRKLFFSWDKEQNDTDFLLVPEDWTDEYAKTQIPKGGFFICIERLG